MNFKSKLLALLKRDYFIELGEKNRPEKLEQIKGMIDNLDEEIKNTDKSLGIWSDGGKGNYKKIIK